MNYINTVSGSAVTKSQPGISFGYEYGSGIDGYILRIFRYYPKKRNRLSGLGDIARLADYGKRFDSAEELRRYSLERGYIQPYFRKS